MSAGDNYGAGFRVTHVTELEGPDSAGHWSFTCGGCGADQSGYEAAEIVAMASEHGPISATSPRPCPCCAAEDYEGDPGTADGSCTECGHSPKEHGL